MVQNSTTWQSWALTRFQFFSGPVRQSGDAVLLDLLVLELLDQLFNAIREDDGKKIDKILNREPALLNMRSQLDDVSTRIGTPQQVLEAKKFEYLLTQDVLRHKQDEDVQFKVTDYCWQCPLHLACMLGSERAVNALLERKRTLDLNARNGSDETALGIACRGRHLAIAKLLLDKADHSVMDINLMDDAGNTPMHYLAGRGIYPSWPIDEVAEKTLSEQLTVVVELILDSTDYESTHATRTEVHREFLQIAASWGSTDVLRGILRDTKVYSLNASDGDGWTALHWAASGGHIEVVKMLLDAGADRDLPTKVPDAASAADLAFELDQTAAWWFLRSYRHTTQDQGTSDSEAGAWTWSGKGGGVPEEVTIHQLLHDGNEINRRRERVGRKGTVWCHLPANDVSGSRLSTYITPCPGAIHNSHHSTLC